MTDAPAPHLSPRQKKAQVEAHLVTVAEMYLGGKLQTEIAAAIQVSQGTVSRYIKKLQERWQVAAKEFIDARKARELVKIDQVERQYWEAWADSRQPGETKVEREKETSVDAIDSAGVKFDLPAKEREFTLTTRGQAGDPRFMQGVLSCIEMRMKILGGFAPVKLDVTWQEILKNNGINPADAFEQLVAAAAARTATADGGGGDPGSSASPAAGEVRSLPD